MFNLQNIFSITIWMFVFIFLYILYSINYLFFHIFIELFSVVIAYGIFMFTWNSKEYLKNSYLLFLGVGYFFIGSIDLFHTLTYKGMGVLFHLDSANISTQFWISARYMEALSFFLALFFNKKKINIYYIFIGYFIISILILTSIINFKIFPICYIEGSGLTPFKKLSEYIISLILLISFILLNKNKSIIENKKVLFFINLSIIITILSELAFTLYVDVYGIFNSIGHIFKFITFYLIYLGIIQLGIKNPIDLLFQKLTLSEKYLNTILNTQKNMVIVVENGKVVKSNRAFLNFFGYRNLSEFKNKYNYFCDLFEKVKRKGFIYKEKKGLNWLEYIVSNPNSIHKVLIKEKLNYIFKINAQKIENTNKSVIVLTDISELEEYRKNLELRVQKEIKEKLQKEKMLIQQSKMAIMGEMIGAISHQWKQPLNTLSLIIQNIELSSELGDLNKNHVKSASKNSLEQIEFMAKTIDDFKNFFQPNKKKTLFDIKKTIDDTLFLLGTQLITHNINLSIKNSEFIKFYGYENELKQVILNIINNAKDAILKKQENKKFKGEIEINIFKQNDRIIITIIDNAGGIRDEILDRIFEPYVSTKGDKGTGIGLYMSKMIIESMHGIIYAENISNNDKIDGAKFSIELRG